MTSTHTRQSAFDRLSGLVLEYEYDERPTMLIATALVSELLTEHRALLSERDALKTEIEAIHLDNRNERE